MTRPEDDVPCPACGKAAGDSCDGPASHPSRLAAHDDVRAGLRPERVELPSSPSHDWIIEDVQIGHRCGLCGKSFDVKVGHVCSEAAISPGGRTFLTTVETPDPKAIDPTRHAPRIARTLMEGPGNRTLVRGCSCGAQVMSAEAYADHVSWPVEAVRAVLGLVGIADDLVSYPEKMKHKDVWQQINCCLEVRR